MVARKRKEEEEEKMNKKDPFYFFAVEMWSGKHVDLSQRKRRE